jgi:hypothetical protein
MSNIAISTRSNTASSRACATGRIRRFIAMSAPAYFRWIGVAIAKRAAISANDDESCGGRSGAADYAHRAAPRRDPVGSNPPYLLVLTSRSAAFGYRFKGEKSTFQRSSSNKFPRSSRLIVALTKTPSSSTNSASAIFSPKRPGRDSEVTNFRLPIFPSCISSTKHPGIKGNSSFPLGLALSILVISVASSGRRSLRVLMDGVL